MRWGPTDGARWGAAVRVRQGRGAHAGRGEWPQIEADRAGYACEASRPDAWALRRGECACGANKNQRTGQAARVSTHAHPSGHQGASIALNNFFCLVQEWVTRQIGVMFFFEAFV